MNRRSLSVVPLALAVPLLALAAGAASAHPAAQPHKGQPAHVATARASGAKAPGATRLPKLAGYQQVRSASFSDPAGAQAFGTVACPSGTRLVGGGALLGGLDENLNSSIPMTDGLTWRVYVSNAGSSAGSFYVYADCVKAVAQYRVMIGTQVTNGARSQTSATVTCPTGTVPFGGGGFATSGSTAVNLNTSIPTSNGWRVDVNNASTGTDMASAYAVCGTKPSGYAQVSGDSTSVPAGDQNVTSVTCPSGTKVLGGGVYSGSGLTSVNLNSSYPSWSTTWIGYDNNRSSTATSEIAYAVCAQTT